MYQNEFDATMQMIQGKWKIVILYYLDKQKVGRFNEIQRHIETISHKTLSNQLKELEDDGLILRTAYNVVPPKVEYSLTDKGLTMIPVLDSICNWGLENVEPTLMKENTCT